MKVGEGGGVDDEQEEVEVLELAIDQAIQMIETRDIKDGKTIMLLQYVQLKGILSN